MQAHEKAIKAEELRNKVFQASYEESVHQLGSDLDKLKKYFVDCKELSARWSDTQVVEKRRLYEKGMKAVTERMTTHFNFMQPSASENVVQEYHGWKMLVQQKHRVLQDSPTWTICFCDFSRCGTIEQLSTTIKNMSDIVQIDGNNCGVVFMPMMYNKLPVERQIALTRKIEDLMIARTCTTGLGMGT